MAWRSIGFGLVAMALAGASEARAAELTGTLKKIKETGTITLGHRDSSIPFSYYDDQQNVVGYSIELCGKIVDAVKRNWVCPG